MALQVYVFQSDLGANVAGDVVHLEPDQAQSLVDAGILAEATADDVGGGEEEPAEDAVPEEAAITRAIASGFKSLQSTLVKNAQVAKAAPVSISNAAVVKTPAIKSLGDLCRQSYLAKNGNDTARNKLRAYQQEIRQKAPVGANEGTNSQGGYATIPEWSDEIFSKVKNLPRLLDMTSRQTISGNTLNIPAILEAGLADGSRGGGILSYWVSEGSTATTSYPAMNQVQAVLNTQVVIVPVTNQLLEDNAYNLDAFIGEKVGEEFVFQEDRYLISGSGTGQPKGILNTPALVTITKESAQAAASLDYRNLVKMWAALWPASRQNAVWLANPQVYQQLAQMTFGSVSGTYPAFGGVTFNVADEFPMRVFGKPVIECLMAPDLGLPGDLILCDLKQMVTAEHPGLQVAVSDQVYFTSLQTLFRFVRRYDIQSPWTAAVTDFNGHYSYSWAVCLQSRGT